MRQKYNLAELNALGKDEFVRVVGPVFEHSPWVAEIAWSSRPFEDRDQLEKVLCETVRLAKKEHQLTLICAHPDLVGKSALSGSLTPASRTEQSGAGLDRLSPEDIQKFQRHNAAYQHKFGFPFIICARLNKKDAILKAFPLRLQNSREIEIDTALNEIYKIANFRLQDIVA